MIDAFRGWDAVSRSATREVLEYFWHPVCTRAELEAARPHPLAVQLLGRDLAIADVGDAADGRGRPLPAPLDAAVGRLDRTGFGALRVPRLALLGRRRVRRDPVDTRTVRCRSRQCVETFEAALAYDLVWVRLDAAAGTTIPANPAWDDASMHVVTGAPYTWPTSALRRVENFVDLAHFAWVHDGTLGRRDEPVPPMPVGRARRRRAALPLRPARRCRVEREALFGHSRYRMPMPCTVDIEFHSRRARAGISG